VLKTTSDVVKTSFEVVKITSDVVFRKSDVVKITSVFRQNSPNFGARTKKNCRRRKNFSSSAKNFVFIDKNPDISA
jgi:hypothetical protein